MTPGVAYDAPEAAIQPQGEAVRPQNIILTGFMGTGKTTIGREVAARLGRPFVDLDDLIAARAGKSIARIFAEEGEPAFRALEAQICREMSAPAGLVIATGGGALVDAANRAALESGGTIVCLDSDPATILARLEGQHDRPLLAVADREARIAELLSRRAAAYAALPHHLDTRGLSIPAAAERVLGIVAGLPKGGHRLVVGGDPARPGAPSDAALAPVGRYDVLIADGLLGEIGQRLLAAGLRPGRCAVITNPTVAQHHAGTLLSSLRAAGFEPFLFEVPDGESFKTLATASHLYARCAAARLARGEPILALGGGVIGDLAGFVAATWLRGVPLVQVPTSLLAMVDASVGGKVAVDLPEGKNLVGAFKPPKLVLIDPMLLKTLPPAEYRAGMAEVLKAGLLGDAALFGALAGGDDGARPAGSATELATATGMIAAAVRVKARIVERDPFESGERAWLNLGHTFGHALELLSGYRLRHGEAVGLGLMAAAEMSASLGYCDSDLPSQVRAAVEGWGLPTCYDFDPAAALAAMGTDKKRVGRSLRFVLLRRIGEVILVDGVPETEILRALHTVREQR